jgi:chemotaxis protein MotB
MAKGAAPIIIKKIKKGDHGGHHGGAWKVAYADFVTAMMAFFLLLWLLNVTTDVQKRGIADYFEPTITSKSMSGAGGVLGGQTVGSPGSQSVPLSAPSLDLSRASMRQPNEGDDGDEGGTAGQDKDADNDAAPPPDTKKLSDEELKQEMAEREDKRFDKAEQALHDAVKEVPELRALANNLIIDRTPEGLRIQIVDQDRTPMFPSGSAEMLDPAKKLLSLVAQVVRKLPNKISITGHTDSTQFALGAKYSNWELSADRANASRREFLADGLPPERLSRVIGTADQEPLVTDNPGAPTNRRISIVLLRAVKEADSDDSAPASPTKP